MTGPQNNNRENIKQTPEAMRSLDDLFSLIYEELRRLAAFARRNEVHSTINSTALVHEAWLKLKDSPELASKSRPEFKAIAGKVMRQVLVDEARRRTALKRGGAAQIQVITEGEAEQPVTACNEELLTLHNSLDELAALNHRQAQVVEQRFFGGLNVEEIADLLGVSESAIERDWRSAKAWLASRIRPERK